MLWPRGIILFFAFIISLNGLFLYLAIDSYHGTVETNPYIKSITYEQTIQALKNASRFSEPPAIELDQAKMGSSNYIIKVSLPISLQNQSTVVQITLKRPDTDRFDIYNLPLEFSDGHFFAQASLPVEGLWLSTITAIFDNRHYQWETKLSIYSDN